MAQWSRTQELPTSSLMEVQATYNAGFPIEVRHFFAHWIEEKPWNDLEEGNPTHEQYAAQLQAELVTLIEGKALEPGDFITRLRFRDIASQFQKLYREHPMQLVHIVKSCLAAEQSLIAAEERRADLSPSTKMFAHTNMDEKVRQDIKQSIEYLVAYTKDSEQTLRLMQSLQERFVIDYQNQAKVSASLAHVRQQPPSSQRAELENKLKREKDEKDAHLLNSAQQILTKRIELAKKHKENLKKLEILQKRVIDEELIKWKHQQQLAGNGAPFDSTLIDTIQNWCESLVDIIWTNRLQIIKVDLLRQQLPIDMPQGVEDIQPELNPIVTGLLSSVVTSTFIVEQQPPQVLKKDSRFSATVRLLVGGKLNLQLTPPRVQATIINEQQARGLIKNEDGQRQLKSGDILNNEGNMDYHHASGHLSIVFRNMSLKNIKRADKRGAEVHTVAEEKFCILFSSDFNIGGNELKFHVWTLSLPVVVTVHGNQECQATATFLWDNQFSEPGRIPFQVPEAVPWPEIARMLSTKFLAMTGKGLDDNSLSYLATKIFSTGKQDFSQMMVTWLQFNKENLPTRSFTFWEWFWSIGKLVKEHLKAPWNDGRIIGFMDKTESNDMLLKRPNGTFLLRFSDGTVGGITIAWVAENPDKPGDRQVWNLAPFTVKDFAIRGLGDRIKDLPSLVTLYPDIPKDRAFSKYYSPLTDATLNAPEGYVKTTLITVIEPGLNMGDAMNIDNPHIMLQPQFNCHSPSDNYNMDPLTPNRGDASGLETDLDAGNAMALPPSPDYQNDLDLNEINEWISSRNFR